MPPRLRVGINALHIAWGVNAGTETYLANVVTPWYESPTASVEFTLFCQSAPAWWQGERSHFKLAVIPAARRLWARVAIEQLLLPLLSYRRLDVVFHPGYVGSWIAPVKQVITIHDAFAWVCPREIGRAKEIYWKTLIPASARNADRIIADTQVTARDISHFCSIPPEKIQVVHLAGDHLASIAPEPAVLSRIGVAPGEYFLCVGIFKEIKNPWRILSAYKRYRILCGATSPKRLVLAGHIAGRRATAMCDSASATPGVVVAGRVSDGELAALYSHSAGLVFPSLYEGFGLPILEAQRLGCPVITSNLSCMPEVAGGGAILVDPIDEEDIALALVALHGPKSNELIALGRENLTRFSWEVASRTTLDVIKSACDRIE